MATADKLALAKEARQALDKQYGKGTVMSLNEKVNTDVDVISTGSIGLDRALGIKGLPKGRIIEIYGPESSGKTTLALHVMAEARKKGGQCLFIDAEHAFDKEYAQNLGVGDIDIAQPDNGEQALEIADKLISTGAYDVVVIDSVAALVPKAELEGEMGESKMGLHARLMSQALRKLTGTVHKNNVLLIFINQLREKIGVMYGDPSVTTGGNALKFYASVRLNVTRSLTADNSVLDKNKEKIGNQTTVKIVKNKIAPPFRKAEFDILYGIGIDKIGEIIRLAKTDGLVKKWGDSITYNEVKYTVDEFAVLVRDNEGFYKEIYDKFVNAD